MHIIVGGCGRLGAEVAELLSEDPDTDVVVVDVNALSFDRLGSTFNGETIVGDVTDRDVLEQAGVEYADGLIAVTRSDNANLMTVEIAEHLYGVPRAIARLFNPEREPVYRKLGIRYVSGTSLLAKLFLNEFREDQFPLHVRLRHPDITIVDLEVSSGGHGALVEQLEIDGRLRVAAIQRGARTFIPLPGDRLERGDVVTAAIRSGTAQRLLDLVEPTHRAETDRTRWAGITSRGPAAADGHDDAPADDHPRDVDPTADAEVEGIPEHAAEGRPERAADGRAERDAEG